jgi:hypothetical protein
MLCIYNAKLSFDGKCDGYFWTRNKAAGLVSRIQIAKRDPPDVSWLTMYHLMVRRKTNFKHNFNSLMIDLRLMKLFFLICFGAWAIMKISL